MTSAFASQSTGLKVKGDGLHFPPDNYDPSYQWGECPSFVPGTISSLRAASLRSHMCTLVSLHCCHRPPFAPRQYFPAPVSKTYGLKLG